MGKILFMKTILLLKLGFIPIFQAKKTYKEAISSGHTALFISEADTAGDTFECKLGNLPAGESAVLTLSYVVELSVQPDGKLRFILPTVLNPRYSPGR